MQKKIKRRITSDVSPFDQSIHPVLQRVYLHRGISGIDALEKNLKHLLPAQGLKGIESAVSLLAEAIQQGQRILVVGDFDADGATSSALAVLALSRFGAADVDFLVPNRFEYGYGLTPEIVAVALASRPDLLVTVDNGISSIDGVRTAREAGIKVIVTDHHLPGEETPDAHAIVNPNQHGCEFPSKALAGVGVIFYVMTALRSHLREQGWFEAQGLAVPNMADFLDLVALGTVADVVPLDRNNRILVHQGIERIRAGRCRAGIKAIIELGNRQLQNVVASDLGFVVGPRLNAAGRLDDMTHGILCLLAESEADARGLAEELDALNRSRREIESSMQYEALKHLEKLQLKKGESLPLGVCLFDPQWHQGVIGILASRIKDRLHRPIIAFADAGNDEIKGSARSVAGVHIRDVLDAVAARHPQLISKFGGHAMAAGLSIKRAHYAAFADAFDAEVRMHLSEQDLKPEILSDGDLDWNEIDLPLAELLRRSEPWGQGFPEPVFDGEFELLEQRIVGEKHLKMVLSQAASNRVIDAIAFNIDTEKWPDRSVRRAKLAYKLDVNAYRGVKSPQLLVEYIEPA